MEFEERDDLDIGHVRVWLSSEENRPQFLGELFRAVYDSSTISLEFWDPRKPTVQRIRDAALEISQEGQTGGLFVFDMSSLLLENTFQHLSSESFGGWIHVDKQQILALAAHERLRARTAELPAGGRFVVFSLYDENFEVFASDATDRELIAEMEAGLEKVGQ